LTTVDAALRDARSRGVARLDAHLLLAHVLGQSRAWLLAHGDDVLSDDHAAAFDAFATRRAAGEPFAYLVGEREFHGLTLAVSDAVLVPRPDTETLVEWVLEILQDDLREFEAPAVLDLGTGSGAIALALKDAWPRARVWAGERSAQALAVARANAQKLSLDVRFVQGDWWSALAGEPDAPTFDLVVSNPPYIAADDPHLAALTHEPLSALVAGDDGLADIRRIAEGARGRLRAGGWLLFEHGWEQAQAVQALLQRSGFGEVSTRVDIEGRARCTGGRLISSL
jgi:release factor glutamine methyltransferase